MDSIMISNKEKALENIEIYREWVKRLESGEYKQGVGLLKENVDGVDCYCCLGILNEVCGIKQAESGDCYKFIAENGNFTTALLLQSTVDKLGLISTVGTIQFFPYFESLVGKNDNHVPFTEIAKIIRQEYFEHTGVEL